MIITFTKNTKLKKIPQDLLALIDKGQSKVPQSTSKELTATYPVKAGERHKALAYRFIGSKHVLITFKGNIGAYNTWAVFVPHTNIPLKNKGTLAERIVALCNKKGYKIDTRPGYINLVGIEGMLPNGKLSNNTPDYFDDTLGVLEFNRNGVPSFKGYLATTSPGAYYTRNRLNPKGAAQLAFGQHECWQVGKHRKQYPALVQTGGKVTVFRDGNNDFNRSGDTTQRGLFGINSHHGYNNPVKKIGRASAGCQVVRLIAEFRKVMQRVMQSKQYLRNRRHVFRYTLLNAREL